MLTATFTALIMIAACTPVQVQIPGQLADFPPQPHRRFIRVGTSDGSQFTDEQFRFLAANFDYVLFAKFHGGFDIQRQHEAARRLAELNPEIRAFPYISTKYWFEQNKWDGPPFDPAWYLRNNEGEIVYRTLRRDDSGSENVPYVDLANPEYRKWALSTIRSWLAAAPYAGISFDAAVPIGDDDDGDFIQWRRRIGQDRLNAYNAGMRTLLEGAKQLVGEDREVIYNGIAPTVVVGPNRNLGLLQVADGALNERFCIDAHGQLQTLGDDLHLMERYEDRQLFLRTNYPDDLRQDERERYGRFCLGSFLLGWRPGLSYYQFGDDYTADQLGNDISVINLPIGSPMGPYQSAGGLLSRMFTNGELYVNAGDRPAVVTLSRTLIGVDAGTQPTGLEAGSTITVSPRDAVFLLDPDATAALERTP
ncbi:MAG: putative glycoside hydrolase [Egibacteraceae bacterium]